MPAAPSAQFFPRAGIWSRLNLAKAGLPFAKRLRARSPTSRVHVAFPIESSDPCEGGTRCPQRVAMTNAASPDLCAFGDLSWHSLRRSRSTSGCRANDRRHLQKEPRLPISVDLRTLDCCGSLQFAISMSRHYTRAGCEFNAGPRSIRIYFGASEATIFSKRGSPRSGSQKGSSFN